MPSLLRVESQVLKQDDLPVVRLLTNISDLLANAITKEFNLSPAEESL